MIFFFRKHNFKQYIYICYKQYQSLYDMDFELKFEVEVNVVLVTTGLLKFWIDTKSFC